MKLFVRHIGAFILFATVLFAQEPASQFITGESYWGGARFVEYIPGELPVIISVPHDGALKPEMLADRMGGVTKRDSRTQDLARYMSNLFAEKTGKRPHLIFSHLQRKKLDPNRGLKEAAQFDPLAVQAWSEYHSFIDTAQQIVRAQFGTGCYIDLHGHSHKKQYIELGYGLTYENLSVSDDELNEFPYNEMTTLGVLLKKSAYSHSELIRGPVSFGAFLVKHGLPACPSPEFPVPEDENFFNGGYTTIRHARDGQNEMFGFQIETNADLRADDSTVRSAAVPLTDALIEYLTLHWNKPPFAAGGQN
jgi:hypothetical protein